MSAFRFLGDSISIAASLDAVTTPQSRWPTEGCSVAAAATRVTARRLGARLLHQLVPGGTLRLGAVGRANESALPPGRRFCRIPWTCHLESIFLDSGFDAACSSVSNASFSRRFELRRPPSAE